MRTAHRVARTIVTMIVLVLSASIVHGSVVVRALRLARRAQESRPRTRIEVLDGPPVPSHLQMNLSVRPARASDRPQAPQRCTTCTEQNGDQPAAITPTVLVGNTSAVPAETNVRTNPVIAPIARTVETTRMLELEHGPFRFRTHPEALAFVPAGLDPSSPLSVVVFIHGWHGCVQVLSHARFHACRAGGDDRVPLDLVGQFRASHRAAILLVPQMAYDTTSSDPGLFATQDGFKSFLQESLEHLADVVGNHQTSDLVHVVLAAHSGGFFPVEAILRNGGVRIDQIALFDALYRDQVFFASWITEHLDAFAPDAVRPMRFVSIFRTDTRSATIKLLAAVGVEADRRGVIVTVYQRMREGRLRDDEAGRSITAVRASGDHGEAVRWNLRQVLEQSVLDAITRI